MSGEEGADRPESSVLLARMFDMLRGIREQQRQDGAQLEKVSTVVLGLVDQVRRLERRLGEVERRISEQKDDLELMIKSEFMGQFGMMRTEFGHRFDELADRITILEGGDPWRIGPR